MVFKATSDGHHWTINGKSYPKTDPIVVKANRRYRWLLDNQSADAHPIHLHRHRFEIVRYAGQPVSGIWKDVVVVPAWKQVEVDVPTTQPGLSLLHCHQQFHMTTRSDDTLSRRMASIGAPSSTSGVTCQYWLVGGPCSRATGVHPADSRRSARFASHANGPSTTK